MSVSLLNNNKQYKTNNNKTDERKDISEKQQNTVSSKSFVILDIQYKTEKPIFRVLLNIMNITFIIFPSISAVQVLDLL